MQPDEIKSEEIIKCVICLNTTEDPRRLPGNYFFSKVWLDKLAQSQCPLYNTKFTRGQEMKFILVEYAAQHTSLTKGQCALCQLKNLHVTPCKSLNCEIVCIVCAGRSTKYAKQGDVHVGNSVRLSNASRNIQHKHVNAKKDCYEVHNDELEHNGMFPKY